MTVPKNRSRQNEKNLLRSTGEYSYVADSFGGVDLTTPDGKCADSRFPFLVNMYRDREKQNAAALETFPGYRQLPKLLGKEGEPIFGLFAHTFEEKGVRTHCLFVHKGASLYLFKHTERDEEAILLPMASVAASPSRGISYGGCFYLLDGERVVCVSSLDTAEVLGDSPYTDEMAEEWIFPETNVYIPTAFLNGTAYEARNLLTDYYDVEYTITEKDRPETGNGLYFRPYVSEGETFLEVYGMEKGRREVIVPAEAEYAGKRLSVRKIAQGAFVGRSIRQAILAPSVKIIEGSESGGTGAFYGCEKLERVVAYGVETVGDNALALCYSLKELVLPESIKSIGANALYGTPVLRTVYYEGDNPDDIGYTFGSDVVVYPQTVLFYGTKGEQLRIPCDPLAFPKTYTLWGGEYGALSSLTEYDGIVDGGSEYNCGYTCTALGAAPLVCCYLKGVSELALSRYLFATVSDEAGVIPAEDTVTSYRVELPDLCAAVVSVSLDGEAVGGTPLEEGAYYSMLQKTVDGRSYCHAVAVTLPTKGCVGRVIKVRCYGKSGVYASRDVADFTEAYPLYEGSSLDVIRRCRFAAVYDGRLFLGGNPELPDLLFYSVTSRKDKTARPYFAATAMTHLPEGGGVTGLLSHPDYLAALTGEGASSAVFYLSLGGESELGHPLYYVTGTSSAPTCTGSALLFRDDPVFLSREGLCGIAAGESWEEKRIENRSYYVDGALCKEALDGASAVKWKHYLALLSSGKIYLADGKATVTENGVMRYEWYILDGIGHYAGAKTVYHHLSVYPEVDGVSFSSLRVNGKELRIMGEERVCDGEVLSAVAEKDGQASGITVFYTVVLLDDGEECYYLVDSTGEKAGGEFFPAGCLASCDGVLYFGTEDGYLFCFNTDKRGVSPVINGTAQWVAPDEIHAFYYTFDGMAYDAGLATAFADMGAPHIAKTTSRRSLTVKCKTVPYSSFCVEVRTDKRPFHETVYRRVGKAVASTAFSEKDYGNYSFSPEDRLTLTLDEHERRWVEKQLRISARVFRSPFGVDCVAYRYTVAGRPRL